MSVRLDFLAKESGMTPEEFYQELRRCYATHVSLALDDKPPEIIHEYSCNFGNHRIIIRSYKEQLN